MIRDFDQVKKQLAELAAVINSFKSEPVQLRIIELVLGNPPDGESVGHVVDKPTEIKAITHRPKPKGSSAVPSSKKRRAPGGSGAVAALTQLTGSNFFDKPKTINDIIKHCELKRAHKFKANEFSGKLGRLVRNGELTREKNADNQYEYKKP